jgi:hypothetical protein
MDKKVAAEGRLLSRLSREIAGDVERAVAVDSGK